MYNHKAVKPAYMQKKASEEVEVKHFLIKFKGRFVSFQKPLLSKVYKRLFPNCY